jgi:hypothetical protein
MPVRILTLGFGRRRPNGRIKAPKMADENDDPFAKEYDRNTLFEHICAGVLVVGLAAELINAAIWFEGVKTIAEMGAVTLIVLGVAGEVWFGNRARIAGDKQMAELRARAAEANLKAEKERSARLKFEEDRAWRSITSNQSAKIAEVLRKFSGQRFHILTYRDDPECERFTLQIVLTLSAAGWTQDGRSTTPMGLDERLIKLSISNKELTEASYAFMNAMRNAGFEDCATVGNPDINQDVIEIRIGRKAERAVF